MSMQSDIARKFDLPERQSKLATMLREEGLRDEQVYCICRSTDVSRFMIGCDRCEEWYHGNCINVTEQEANRIRKFYCQKCRAKNLGLAIKYKTTKTSHDKHESKHHSDKKQGHHKKSEKKSSHCGECEACYVREDCGRCEHCKDKPKFGGPGKLGQKCKKRQCTNFYHLARKNKDHGRSDHTYISSSSPSVVKKPVSVKPLPIQEKVEDRPLTPISSKPREKSPQRPVHTEPFKLQRPIVLQDTQQRKKVYEADSDWLPGVLRSRNSDEEVSEPKKKKISHKDLKITKKVEPKTSRNRKLRKDSSSDSDEAISHVDLRPRQCFGPQCTEVSKPGNKYCSDKCGLKLAEARIYSVLPGRIQEWHMRPCVSTERDRKKLENLREQQQATRDELRILDDKHKELDSFLEKVKMIPPIPEGEAEEEETEYALIYCVTCGHEVASKKALKHMHHCYNKLESQMSFGSMYKTRIEGNNMFCDYYNTQTRTYCKRLRVMCPEHLKEPKVSSNEICGFPLVENVFEETNEICKIGKRMCTRHYLWEKLRRATIDMERVRQCLQLDELVEQERTTRSAMTNRSGVLGLMLHSTYNHPLLEKLQKQRQLSQGQSKPNKGNISKAPEQRGSTQNLPAKQPPLVRTSSVVAPSITSPQKTTTVVRMNLNKAGGVKVLQSEQKFDHPYHRINIHTDKPKPRIVKATNVKGSQKYVVDQGATIGNKRTHDHLYSSSNNPVEVKRHQDHMYYANTRPK